MYKQIVNHIRSHYPRKDFIPLHEPHFIGNDRKYVLDAIDSTFVSSVGKYVDQFEEMMRKYTGAKYAVATVNGTAALHMCLLAAGVKQNDLVLTQAFSFVATCNAISYLGAQPLFIDIDKMTLGLSAAKLEKFFHDNTEVRGNTCVHKRTGQRIAACVPMHTFGHCVDLYEIIALCDKYFVPLIEDAAESIGSFYKGRHTGTLGLMGAFSFNGNKTITCGGGGVITTNNESIARLCKHLTTQAKAPHRWEFNHDHIGYNYRLPNLNAALACAQMEMLNEFLKDKRELAGLYRDFFNTVEGVEFITEPEDTRSNYWLNSLLFENRTKRDEFLSCSNDLGVMTRPAWTLMHKLPMFANCLKADLTNSEDIESRLVNIPSSARIKR